MTRRSSRVAPSPSTPTSPGGLDFSSAKTRKDLKASMQELDTLFGRMHDHSNNEITLQELRMACENAPDLADLEDTDFTYILSCFDISKDGRVEKDELYFILGVEHLTLNSSNTAEQALHNVCRDIIKSRSRSKRQSRRATTSLTPNDSEVASISKQESKMIRRCDACELTLLVMIMLGVAALVLILIVNAWDGMPEAGGMPMQRALVIAMAAVAVLAYLCHLYNACDSPLTRELAEHNTFHGLQAVAEMISEVQDASPSYTWTVECYHFQTLGQESVRSNSNSTGENLHVARSKRREVVTYRSTTSGTLPAIDNSEPFVPDTSSQMTELQLLQDLDTSQSDYEVMKKNWFASERARGGDLYARFKCVESLPFEELNLVEWVDGSRPWWMTVDWWMCAIACLFSSCFRCAYGKTLKRQTYTFRKQCGNIMDFKAAVSPLSSPTHSNNRSAVPMPFPVPADPLGAVLAPVESPAAGVAGDIETASLEASPACSSLLPLSPVAELAPLRVAGVARPASHIQ